MKLGIIGGSGLYNIDNLKIIDNIDLITPFGKPSGYYSKGLVDGLEIVFLPRHGEGHTISPSEINHRANIYGFKKMGITHILSFSAVGSLKQELAPKDFVIVDQYYDRTKQIEKHTFFRDGIAAHIPFSDPICPEFREFIYALASQAMNESYPGNDASRPKAVNCGTYINMEGPAFSTRAESKTYKAMGMDVIGMTSLAEAKLSREAEICYCSAAMVTDYDCWHSGHEHVTVDMVVKTMQSNIVIAKKIISKLGSSFNSLKRNCSCPHALKNAIMTSHDKITDEIKVKLAPIISKYVK